MLHNVTVMLHNNTVMLHNVTLYIHEFIALSGIHTYVSPLILPLSMEKSSKNETM